MPFDHRQLRDKWYRDGWYSDRTCLDALEAGAVEHKDVPLTFVVGDSVSSPTVREIHDILNLTKPTGYTTVLKLTQIMSDKGLVRRDEVQNQRAHIYEASVPKQETQRQLMGDLMSRAFDGSASELVMQALSAKRATPQELDDIRKLLNKAKEKE